MSPISPEVIQYAVWLYRRFNLSHRDIEDLMSQRGIEVGTDKLTLYLPESEHEIYNNDV